MSDKGQQELGDALQRTVNYYVREYDLTYAEVIGVLHLIMFQMACDACCGQDDAESGEAEESGQE